MQIPSLLSIAFVFFGPYLSISAMPAKETIVQNAIKIDALDQLPPQLVPLLTSYRVFLIGEIHGTKEAPEFCLGLIKMLAAHKKTPLLLALEISEAEQSIFDEFMRTGNSQVFAQSSLFTDNQSYGLSSEAMVHLLTSLRCIENVRVLCSLSKDSPSKSTFQEIQEERDFKWATLLLEQLCSKEDLRVVVLGGSVHMSMIPQTIANVPVKTMGYYLTHSTKCPLSTSQILSIDIKSKEVNAWGCFFEKEDNSNLKFGEMSFSKPDSSYSTAVNWDSYFLKEASMEEGYNATLFIRKLSASKPFLLPH